MLDVAIQHRIGALTLNVEFRLSNPWTVLFAPSGAGKTTVLRTIAGLVSAEQQRIVWTDAAGVSCVLADTATGTFHPPHTRRLSMVMQNSALFPHLTVARNVAYGSHGRSRGLRTDSLFRALPEICRINHLADKIPAQLSGGERQRVALARSLGAAERGVLLDEPFAGIDGTLKEGLLRDVKAWLGMQRVPALHVTHDVGEVFAVADEVIHLSEGRVIGQGTPEVVLREERERLVGWLGR